MEGLTFGDVVRVLPSKYGMGDPRPGLWTVARMSRDGTDVALVGGVVDPNDVDPDDPDLWVPVSRCERVPYDFAMVARQALHAG